MDHPAEGDSSGFLQRLVDYTADHVYEDHRAEFASLYTALGVPDDALRIFFRDLPPLTPRPYALLHGDLHRENFIVDPVGGLWTIDWELARIGDPLYDLATHLHLMRYPAHEEREITERWKAAVGRTLPRAADGADTDLPHYLAFKRLQSVYTDIMRGATRLSCGRHLSPRALSRTGENVRFALDRARPALGLRRLPSQESVVSAFKVWAYAARLRK